MLLRTAALALLALPLALACGSEAEADEASEDMGETQSEVIAAAAGTTLRTTANLNLREEASTAAGVAVILTMPKGAIVKTLKTGTENGFFRVSYKGNEGWAHGKYLTGAGSAAPQADEDDDAPTPSAGFNGKTFAGVTMKWEGDFDYLDKCDPPFGATFSCDGRPSDSFVDNGAWIAVPHAHFPAPLKKGQLSPLCGKSARICKGAQCITAVVMDRGSGTAFEGSTSVLKALGVTAGANGCNSFGTATGVTVTFE